MGRRGRGVGAGRECKGLAGPRAGTDPTGPHRVTAGDDPPRRSLPRVAARTLPTAPAATRGAPPTNRRTQTAARHPRPRSGAYRVFTRKRVFLVKNSVTILRTGLHVAVNGDFAHNNLRSGTAFRPDCYLYTIRSASPR